MSTLAKKRTIRQCQDQALSTVQCQQIKGGGTDGVIVQDVIIH